MKNRNVITLLIITSYLYFFNYLKYMRNDIEGTVLNFLRSTEIISSPNLRILYSLILFILTLLMFLNLKKSNRIQSTLILFYIPLNVFIPYTDLYSKNSKIVQFLGMKLSVIAEKPFDMFSIVLIGLIFLYIVICKNRLVKNKIPSNMTIALLILASAIMIVIAHFLILDFFEGMTV